MFILIKAEVFTADVFSSKGDDAIEAMGSSVCQVDVMCGCSTCRPGVLARARSVIFVPHNSWGLNDPEPF